MRQAISRCFVSASSISRAKPINLPYRIVGDFSYGQIA